MTGAASPHDRDAEDDDGFSRASERVVAGSILGGKYRLISEIGRGGMGSVWRAEHLAWEAPVALKIMNREITARPEAVTRFEREVRLAAGLRSPHVVQVLDHGVDEATRTPFIAMELLEGESLAQRLRRLGSLSPAETFQIFSELVRALTRAHAAGIVHRDLKPDNVFLVRNEDEYITKVLDFGVAKWTTPDITESGLTRPGSVVGTPYYMSPEQIQGSREIDQRVDLWALAAIACECLTGRRPFEAPDFAQLAVLLLGNQGRPRPSSLGPVPPGFDGWFLRATDPDISRRFQTAREMMQSLGPVCDVAISSGAVADGFGATWPIPPDEASRHESSRPESSRHESSRNGSASRSSSGWRHSAPPPQRSMTKLVVTTVVTTLVVTGGFAFWLWGGSRSGAVTAQPGTSTARTADRSNEPPVAPVPTPTTGVGIRPIRADEPLSLPQGTSPPQDRSIPPSATTGGADVARDDFSRPIGAHKPRAINDDFDPVRAQQTDAPLVPARPTKPSKPKTRRTKPAPARSAQAQTDIDRPAPLTTHPLPTPKSTAPESDGSLVDGKYIRTNL